MKSFAFHLQKGGVGKTSLSVSIASELSKKGRVVLIDVDPQGNSSSWMIKQAPDHELAAALYGDIELANAITKTEANFEMLPTFGLDGKLKTYGENQLANEPFIFCDVLESLQSLGFDYAVFDLSPGMGRLEKAVLVAADYAITPMTPEIFSLDGIEIFTAELATIKKSMRKAANHTHIIVNAFDSRIAQHKEILGKIKELSDYQIITIPVDPVFRKAQALNSTIDKLHGSDAAKKETLEGLSALAATLA
jgi:chromosome partitioning protein